MKFLPIVGLLLLALWAITAQAATPIFTLPQGGTGTSTAPVSQLLYGGTGGHYQSTGTTTLTASSPLSLSNPVVKVGGSNSLLTIDTTGAWAGNAATASALAADGANCSAGSFPLGVDASGAVQNCTVATLPSAFDIATTSSIAVPDIAYFTKTGGKTTLGSAATTTLTGNAQIAVSNTPYVIGGATPVLSVVADSIGDTQLAFNTGQNLTTASSPTFAGATIGTLTGIIKGATGVLSAAANGTDYTLISANSCSAGNHVSAITAAGAITCSADTGSGLTSYDAWTHPVAGYSATTSAIGVGTSTAWAFLGVNPTAGIASRSFVVGSSTATLFEIENDGRVGIGTSTIGTGLMGQLNVEAGTKTTGLYLTGSQNSFLEGNVQNRNTGNAASSDWVATADNGSATTHFVNFGINGSGGGAAPFTTANHSYLYSQDDPLNIGALGATAPFITLNVGGGATPIEYARLTGTGTGFGTTTPMWTMTLSSSTASQLTLTDASITGAPFNFRANGNYLTISTSSPTTFATTSSSIFQLDRSTASTTLQKLSVIGTATSTINNGLTINNLAASSVVFTSADKGLVTSGLSAALLGSLTDETGTGVAVFGTSPTFTTSIAAVPLISGGAAVGSTLAIQGTSAGSPTTATLTLRAASTISPSMTFTTRGIGAGTTTPGYLLNLASSTAPQLALSDGSITAAPWTLRSGNGNFYLATATPTTFATSSNATLNNPFTIIAGGISGLFGFGSSTPWANVGITNTAGIPAFAIGSTTGTSFIVDALGRTGLGTTSAPFRLTLDRTLGIASSSIAVYEYNPATSTAQAVNCQDSNTVHVSLGTSATTITLGNFVAGLACKVVVSNPAGTAGAITWASQTGQTIYWAGGVAPTQTTTANAREVYSFIGDFWPSNATTTPGVTILGAQTTNIK